MTAERFVWNFEKIRVYLPNGWLTSLESFRDDLRRLCGKRYHDEHDIYVPMEKLLEKIGLKKASTRTDTPQRFIRNRKPKSFMTDLDDKPDFTFRGDENFFLEIKNREEFDKKTADTESPHEQMIRYMNACKIDCAGILFNLQVVRFFLRQTGSPILVSKDYLIDELESSELAEILFSLWHPGAALIEIPVGRLINFVESSNSSNTTRRAVEILIETYYAMVGTSARQTALGLRQVICRLAFMFVIESRKMIPSGTVKELTEKLSVDSSWYRKLFNIFDKGSKAEKIPRFNGRLFDADCCDVTLSPSARSELKNCIFKMSELLVESDARISDELPGLILELLYEVDHKKEKLVKAEIIADAQKRITDRMEKGTFYTGRLVSELAASELVREENDFLNTKIVDMCAGSGSLLIPAIRHAAMLLSRALKWTYYDSLVHIIEKNIYAIDRDPVAIELVRLNLAIDTVRFGVPLVDSSDQIFVGDALDKTVLRDELADLLISNPPYLAWEKIMQKDCNIDGGTLKQNSTLFGQAAKPDLWYFFLERALRVVKSGGRLAFIVSDKWIASDNAVVRSIFRDTVTLEKLIHVGYPVFDDSTSCPCILLIKNEPPPVGHSVVIESYRCDGKRATEMSIEKREPANLWVLSQGELDRWLEVCIPFGNDMEAARSRNETDLLPKLRELGLCVFDPRLQAKISDREIRNKKTGKFTVPVMAGRGFGSIMGYARKSDIPETWTFVGKPALLIHQKGKFIETIVTRSCPAVWKTITVIGCDKSVPASVYEEIETYLKSKFFRDWYMMRYSTTWTQGGYQFIKGAVESYPIPREISRKVLGHTEELIDYSAA